MTCEERKRISIKDFAVLLASPVHVWLLRPQLAPREGSTALLPTNLKKLSNMFLCEQILLLH